MPATRYVPGTPAPLPSAIASTVSATTTPIGATPARTKNTISVTLIAPRSSLSGSAARVVDMFVSSGLSRGSPEIHHFRWEDLAAGRIRARRGSEISRVGLRECPKLERRRLKHALEADRGLKFGLARAHGSPELLFDRVQPIG